MTDKPVADKYIKNSKSEEIGGTLVMLLGGQGSGKTTGMWKMADTDFQQDRIVFWRGQTNCSWIGLAANDLPVTLWIHETIEDFKFKLRGSKREGIDSREIDIEDAEDVDVNVRQFSGPEELIKDAEIDRINVYYVPGEKFEDKKEFYFFLDHERRLAKQLNEREWGDPVSKYDDEFGNLGTEDDSYPYHRLIKYRIPNEYADFRKNGVKEVAAAHSTSEVHYKFHDVKFNNLIYMRGAKVRNSKDPEVDQSNVNSLDEGHFVISEGLFDKDHFEEPTYPHQGISWMPKKQSRKLVMEMSFDIPNIVPEKVQVDADLEDSYIDRSDLDEFIGTREAAEILDTNSRGVRRKIQQGEIPGIKVNNRHILSVEQVVGMADS
ncbi:MAG: helix-turn-helix domain-containing protein [Candidatus Nanohalobium sp.]